MPSEQPKPFALLDFDLTAAVTSQLVAKFDALSVGRLTTEILSQVDPEQGVFQLYLLDKLMYVGKAVDSLPKRLNKHLRDLPGRKNINIADLGFKCAIIHRNWMPYVDLAFLLELYKRQGLCKWNKRRSRT